LQAGSQNFILFVYRTGIMKKNTYLFFCKAIWYWLIIIFPSLYSSAQTNISGIVNTYFKVIEVVPAKACVRVANIAGLSLNKKVIIVQMKGASIVTATGSTFGDIISDGGSGLYEIGTVCYIRGDSVFLFHNLINTYNTATGKVQLVQFAEYLSATVVDTVKALSWDSARGTGGVIALYADQDITLNKPVYADSSGYRGGIYVSSTSSCSNLLPASLYVYNATANAPQNGAYKGEGIANLTAAQTGGRGAPANGGGGGNNHNNSGGGGANLTAGGLGGGNSSSSGCATTLRGMGGKALSSSGGQKIFFGGGGGAGHNNNGVLTLGGGNGGGMIFIWANNLIGNNEKITASGGIGGQSQADGAGGGGAGGTIIMHVNNYTGNTNILANGGDGGNSNDGANIGQCFGGGGGGSGGTIYFTAATPSITTSAAGGLAGVESARDVSCAAAQAAAPGSNGQIISNYTFTRSSSTAGYCAVLLSAKLTGFTATVINKKVVLKWEIQNQEQAAYFIIEKSSDNTNWQRLGSVTANEQNRYYSLIDENASGEIIFYRFKIIGKDNSVILSPVRRVRMYDRKIFNFYPNPANDKIVISGLDLNTTELKLSDISGKIVLQKNISAGTTELDISFLQSGIYFIMLNGTTQKLIVR
jgi:hypothetical protein